MLFSEPALKNEKWGMKIESVEDVERNIIWNLEAVKSSQSSIVTTDRGHWDRFCLQSQCNHS